VCLSFPSAKDLVLSGEQRMCYDNGYSAIPAGCYIVFTASDSNNAGNGLDVYVSHVFPPSTVTLQAGWCPECNSGNGGEYPYITEDLTSSIDNQDNPRIDTINCDDNKYVVISYNWDGVGIKANGYYSSIASGMGYNLWCQLEGPQLNLPNTQMCGTENLELTTHGCLAYLMYANS